MMLIYTPSDLSQLRQLQNWQREGHLMCRTKNRNQPIHVAV
jgi:hypothetical protein